LFDAIDQVCRRILQIFNRWRKLEVGGHEIQLQEQKHDYHSIKKINQLKKTNEDDSKKEIEVPAKNSQPKWQGHKKIMHQRVEKS
jgi:hypothetical protein